MLRCIEDHESPLFGTIPVGSLWADDSPFVLGDYADKFAPVDDAPVEVAAKPVVRKFAPKSTKGGPA